MPTDDLLIAFWKCLRDDLSGNGVLCHEVPANIRQSPYPEQREYERAKIKRQASEFIGSDEFGIWARVSGFTPEALLSRFQEVS